MDATTPDFYISMGGQRPERSVKQLEAFVTNIILSKQIYSLIYFSLTIKNSFTEVTFSKKRYFTISNPA
jgi:hypothetical protein